MRAFRTAVEQAEAFVHVSDVAERDILDGDSAADAIGGFAAAAQALGRIPCPLQPRHQQSAGSESPHAA